MSIIGVGLGGGEGNKWDEGFTVFAGKMGLGRHGKEGQISTTITATSTRLRLDQAALLRATLVYYTCTMIDALVYILDDQELADIYSSLDSELCTKGPASPSLCSSIRPCLNAQVPGMSRRHHLPANQPSRSTSAYPQFLFMSGQSIPFPGFPSYANSNRVAAPSPRTIISTTASSQPHFLPP